MLTILDRFKRDLQGDRFFATTPVAIVAVSAGVDSMTLLTMMQQLPFPHPLIVVAHVNHELRSQSIEEEKFLRCYCRQHGLTLAVAHWDRDRHPDHGIEEAGRRFRYRFFARLMKQYGAGVLLTAHHQDDQAETILMKLTRGGEIDTIAGLQKRRPFAGGYLLRPCLDFTKKELRQYARENHVRWYEDVTNADLTIQRNRYRHRILPALKRENPRVVDHLSEFHDQLVTLLRFRDEELNRLMKKCVQDGKLILPAYQRLSSNAQQLVLVAWLKQLGLINLKKALLQELLALIDNPQKPQAQMSLPQNHLLVKTYSYLIVTRPAKEKKRAQQREGAVLKLGQWFSTREGQIAVQSCRLADLNGQLVAKMWLRPDQLPLSIRQWQRGDRLRLRNGHHQRVSRILIDQHVPANVRHSQQVLVDRHDRVLWVIGRKTAWYDYPQHPQAGHDYYLVRRSNTTGGSKTE